MEQNFTLIQLPLTKYDEFEAPTLDSLNSSQKRYIATKENDVFAVLTNYEFKIDKKDRKVLCVSSKKSPFNLVVDRQRKLSENFIFEALLKEVGKQGFKTVYGCTYDEHGYKWRFCQTIDQEKELEKVNVLRTLFNL